MASNNMPKWVDVVTCMRKGTKYQAIRWKHSNGTMVDTIYYWGAATDFVYREPTDGSETLAAVVARQGMVEVAP